MISRRVQSSQYETSRRNPVQAFGVDVDNLKKYQQDTLKPDNTANDIDPRKGFVRVKDNQGIVASANFYRSGDFVCQFAGDKTRVTVNEDAKLKGSTIFTYDYDKANQSLEVQAYSVAERDAGPLKNTDSTQVHYDLNKEEHTGLKRTLQHEVYPIVKDAKSSDNTGDDRDPRPGHVEKRSTYCNGETFLDVSVGFNGQQATGSYVTGGQTIHFDAALDLQGNVELENGNVGIRLDEGGLLTDFRYGGDTHGLDVTQRVSDEISFLKLGIT